MSDERLLPRIPTAVVLKSSIALFWARLGSLNALENCSKARLWHKWLGHSLCSADTLGRVHARMDVTELRKGLHSVYRRLKRNKALGGIGGWDIAVLDGHETLTSYLRHCDGCLKRTVETKKGDRIQYYHRHVTLMLVAEKLRLLLDMEPQRSGEGEVATARRLLERVLGTYPRAFQVLLADALYAEAPFINFLWSFKKHALIVFKDHTRDLYRDALALCALQGSVPGEYRGRQCKWWDINALTSWPQLTPSIRLVRSQETYSVRRQDTQQPEEQISHWMWVTTLSQSEVDTALVVRLGHARWDIENYGFNELVNGWHADHLYKHHPTAIEAFCLVTYLAFNLFHAFLALNLKPQLRRTKTDLFWACVITAEIFYGAVKCKTHRPP